MTKQQGIEPEFSPAAGLRSPHLQSILTSSPVRRMIVRRRSSQMRHAAEAEIIETPHGVRLLGYRSPVSEAAARGLVILLHGWEGSADSNYLLSCAGALHRAGFEVFRLNFRDHGASHHLNEGLFHSCLLEEVVDAVQQIAQRWRMEQDAPVFLTGFSLGGNFALRVALQAPRAAIELRRVIAVCPVIRPAAVLNALEGGFFLYHRYFCDKWRRSLVRKRDLFPQRYQLDEWFKIKGLREQTRYLVEHHSEFAGIEEYLAAYSVADEVLRPLSVATTIVTAADDPVVPVRDFYSLPRLDTLEVRIEKTGGHCGFLSDWWLRSWIDDYLVQRFISEAGE